MTALGSKTKTALVAFCRGRFVPVPVANWEWFLLRLLFAFVVFDSFADYRPFANPSQTAPVGIARLIDLSFLHQPDLEAFGLYQLTRILAAVLLLAYVSGFGLSVSLPLLTLLSILVRTYANSQGFIHHGYQIVSLTLLAQTAVVLWFKFWQWRHKRPFPFPENLALPSYLLYYSQAVIAAAYVASALTKIVNSKGLWIWRARYIAIELVKSHRQMYYKRLDPELAGDVASAAWMAQHPVFATALFGSAFFLELFALVALRDRLWALLTGVALILMHLSIYYLMKLTFWYNVWLLAIFFINLPFWLWFLTRRLKPAPLA